MEGFLNQIILHSLILNLDSQYRGFIENMVSMIKEIISLLILSGIDIIIYVLRPLYILLIAIGVIKYTISGLSPRSRNILVGGVALAIFTEFIVPILLDMLKSY
jgi:hypothetical protein